jgi:predicted aminopeptidase
LLLLTAVAAVSGCQTIKFYAQVIKGQCQLVTHQQAIAKLEAYTNTPPALKARFEMLDQLRAFAKADLKLPVDGHYQKYADVHRPYVVWNVEAAPEFSMEPKTWWYPLIGSQVYRGYFSERAALDYGERLKRQGLDVSVGGSQAYSTLGWFKDPVLNTFIFDSDPDLAELIFHELGHQRLFVSGDTDFNEAFATTVGQEGARRWLRAKGDNAAYEKYQTELRHTAQFARLIMDTRLRLESVYGDQRAEDGTVKATSKNKQVPAEQLRQEKQRILTDLTQQYRGLKIEWNTTEYDAWFSHEINNARLNSVAAYYDLVPGFEHLLALNDGDMEKFYSAAERLSKLPKQARRQQLTPGARSSSSAR